MKPYHNPNLNILLPAWRSYFVAGVLALLFVALMGRAFFLQQVKKNYLVEQGESRYVRTMTLPANRGVITDRNEESLARSTEVQSIWASPQSMGRLRPQQIQQLAQALKLPEADLQQRIADKTRDFVYLRRQLPPQEAEEVLRLGIPGVFKQPEFRRYYPLGEEMAHIVGFTGIDDHGQEGIELAFDKVLSGKPGSREVIRDRRGHVVEDMRAVIRPQDGRDVVLSVDAKLQHLAFSALKAAVEKNKAKAGGIVVLDARTGEVLALANLPTYNPHNRAKIVPEQQRNRALTDTFEPGSTMKPFTIAAGLESGRYKPDTIVQTAPGSITLGKHTIHDAHPHGALTVEQVIQKSSNVGSSKIALSMDPEYMWQALHDIGLGQAPKTGFPGEVSGRLRPFADWKPIEQATMSFGHGLSVSLIQLAHAYSVFATDGRLLPLSFQRVVVPPEGKQVFSPETAMAVRKMLEMVTQPGGTALRAQVPGYRVGGKTGTAHKLEGRGYAANRYVSSFVGMAPMSDPRLIIAVMVDEPTAGEYYGGTVAAPVFSQVMASSLRTLGVEPDAPTNQLLAPAASEAEPEAPAEVF